MRFGDLFQFIVPLTFLAIWALTSILNRDAQPLPPRPRRPGGGGPGGMRPPARVPEQGGPLKTAAGPPARPAPPLVGGGGERPPAWSTPGMQAAPSLGPRQGPRLSNLEEAIVYIENETQARGPGRPSAGTRGTERGMGSGSGLPGSRGQRGTASRRGARARSGELVPARQGRGDSEPRRALSDQINQALTSQRGKPLEITPLAAPMAGLTGSLSRPSTPVQVSLPLSAVPFTGQQLTAAEIQRMTDSPGRLREAFLLSEILQAPVALRPRRHM